MYDELVKRIRQVAEEVCDDYDVDPYNAEQRFFVIAEAADAIGELQHTADAIPHVCECCIGCEVESRGGCDSAFVLSPKRAREYLSKPRWIPVTERLPDFEGCLLCMRKAFVGDKLRYQDILYYEEGTFYMEFEDTPIPTEAITHWMPLPQPPKEE